MGTHPDLCFTPEDSAACRRLVELAWAEDLGEPGDRTSQALIPAEQHGCAVFAARAPGVVAGLPAAALVCGKLQFSAATQDGEQVEPGVVIATVSGSLREILAAERIALNFLQ